MIGCSRAQASQGCSAIGFLRIEHTKWTRFLTVIALLLLGALPAQAEAEGGLVLIHNSESEIVPLSKKDIKDLFLGKRTSFGNRHLSVAVLDEGNVHDAFVREYVGKTTSQFRNYWRIILFSGKGVMPPDFKSETDLVEHIRTTPDTIGYISKATYETVKDKVSALEVKAP